ncbi:DtxR family transcriptional regulator, partial [bacterium]|nr:DtxR family transcriptional regulator [bacterium]
MSSLNGIIGLILLFSLMAFAFWPKSGMLWKWQRGMRSTIRVLIEDALKHLYHQEYEGLKSTLQRIAGSLAISANQAAKLMARLEALGLVKAQAQGFDLTAEGRAYALRMIRIHRLWERYLADETGLSETEWHRKAERLEHNMSTKETEALAASAGYPTYDPHGDPIPTATGKLPPQKGQALTDLEVNAFGRIIHLEDEPSAIYAQLVAEGLHPGMQIRVLEKSPQRIFFVADGEEVVLAPVVAANVTVEPLPKEDLDEGPYETLQSLNVGEKGEVIGISRVCRGQQRRRIMDLGVIPGTIITADMRSAAGDPTA